MGWVKWRWTGSRDVGPRVCVPAQVGRVSVSGGMCTRLWEPAHRRHSHAARSHCFASADARVVHTRAAPHHHLALTTGIYSAGVNYRLLTTVLYLVSDLQPHTIQPSTTPWDSYVKLYNFFLSKENHIFTYPFPIIFMTYKKYYKNLHNQNLYRYY